MGAEDQCEYNGHQSYLCHVYVECSSPGAKAANMTGL